MARWIDATPAQRWHQYQKPADKGLIAEAAGMEAAFAERIGKLWRQRRAAETPLKAHCCARRIRAEITYLRNYRQSVESARQRLAAHA